MTDPLADLDVTRQTASNDLDQSATAESVEKRQQGQNDPYINTPLMQLCECRIERKRHRSSSTLPATLG